MARVVLIGNLAQLTGGVAEFELSATSVKQLYQQLTELHPAIGPHLETGVAVAGPMPHTWMTVSSVLAPS